MSDKKQNKRNGENILHINKMQWHLQKYFIAYQPKMLHEHKLFVLGVIPMLCNVWKSEPYHIWLVTSIRQPLDYIF